MFAPARDELLDLKVPRAVDNASCRNCLGPEVLRAIYDAEASTDLLPLPPVPNMEWSRFIKLGW